MMRIVLAAAIGLVFICGAEVAPADLVETVDAHYAALTALDLTPDGATLVTGGKDGRLKMWDTSTYEMLVDVPACQTQINDIAVSPMTDSHLISRLGSFMVSNCLRLTVYRPGSDSLSLAHPASACGSQSY